mgnify:CR=1 FL=1
MYTCCRYYGLEGLTGHEGDTSFSVEVNHFTFGPGCLREAGSHARALGMRRVALYTDKQVNALPYVATVKRSLEAAGCEVAIYWECEVEPTDRSFRAAAKFAQEGKFDGFVSVGGGSVMDTTKAANLYATYPDDFLAYVNAPIGQGKAVPGPLKPHIACPTTCGTGSEVTGIAIFDLLEQQCKTGILSRHLLPSRALVDPEVTHTLSPAIIAANGFDALSHALESYTARPHSAKAKNYEGFDGARRPMNQGANLWSDMGAREALRQIGLRHAGRPLTSSGKSDRKTSIAAPAGCGAPAHRSCGRAPLPVRRPGWRAESAPGCHARRGSPASWSPPARAPRPAPPAPHATTSPLGDRSPDLPPAEDRCRRGTRPRKRRCCPHPPRCLPPARPA